MFDTSSVLLCDSLQQQYKLPFVAMSNRYLVFRYSTKYLVVGTYWYIVLVPYIIDVLETETHQRLPRKIRAAGPLSRIVGQGGPEGFSPPPPHLIVGRTCTGYIQSNTPHYTPLQYFTTTVLLYIYYRSIYMCVSYLQSTTRHRCTTKTMLVHYQ